MLEVESRGFVIMSEKETSSSVIELSAQFSDKSRVNAELRATILQVPHVQVGLGTVAYTYDKV